MDSLEQLKQLAWPPSLAQVPNIPPSRQTLPQLEMERDYWQAKMDQHEGWGASVGVCAEFRDDCIKWIARRQKEEQEVEDAVKCLAALERSKQS